jgi:hypothetical protein
MFGGQHRVDEAETARAGWGDTNETGSHRDAISRAIGRVCSWTEKIRIKSLETVGVVRDGPDDAGSIAYKGEFKLLGDDGVRWDGAEGQNRTGYAGLFRAALYQ